MSAKDIYHEAVKKALINGGWTITHDPLTLRLGKTDVYVDLGAERLLAAEKGDQLIAVEIKSFVGKSKMSDLEEALGQYILYRDVMELSEPNRDLYLAVNHAVYVNVFQRDMGKLLLENKRLKLLVFDHHEEVILKWID